MKLNLNYTKYYESRYRIYILFYIIQFILYIKIVIIRYILKLYVLYFLNTYISLDINFNKNSLDRENTLIEIAVYVSVTVGESPWST